MQDGRSKNPHTAKTILVVIFSLGNLANEDEVLGWLIHQMKSDEIEEVTDEMLDKILDDHEKVAVVICET